MSNPARAQDKIQLLHADKLAFDENLTPDARKLIGNVALKQNDITLTCDSAYFYSDANRAVTMGNVVIRDEDSLYITCQTARYEGNTKTGELSGGVNLRDGATTIVTQALRFNTAIKTAHYFTDAVITRGNTVLKSKRGRYEGQTKQLFFRYDVKLNNPDLTLTSDSLTYNTNTGQSVFTGNSKIITSDYTVTAMRGNYNTKSEDAFFEDKVLLLTKEGQQLFAKSLKYNGVKRTGASIGSPAVLIDTVQDIWLEGGLLDFDQRLGSIRARNSPILKTLDSQDTTYIFADELIGERTIRPADSIQSVPDTSQIFRAFPRVSIITKDAVAIADSAAYSTTDSIFRLYQNPVVWADSFQVVGDTVMLQKKSQGRFLGIFQNKAFAIGQHDTARFNQIKAKRITLTSDSLTRTIYADKTAESIYWVTEDSAKPVGKNTLEATKLRVFFRDGQIKSLTATTQPKGKLTPWKDAVATDSRLAGFEWKPELKPSLANPRTMPEKELKDSTKVIAPTKEPAKLKTKRKAR